MFCRTVRPETTSGDAALICRWGTDRRHLKLACLCCPHRPGNHRAFAQAKKGHSDRRQDRNPIAADIGLFGVYQRHGLRFARMQITVGHLASKRHDIVAQIIGCDQIGARNLIDQPFADFRRAPKN